MSKELIENTNTKLLPTQNDKAEELVEPIKLDISHIVTEDDTPVDNLGSEKHQRLLTNTLYSSWSLGKEGRKFLASANVGIFDAIKQSPIIPDMFISLDVEVPQDMWKKENRSYFLWEYGKSPDLVLEIVSNKVGNESTSKLTRYARMRVPFYVIYDPMKHISDDVLTVYKLVGNSYQLHDHETEDLLPDLRVTIWQGTFENTYDTWLRWSDSQGNILLTGEELAQQESQQKELAIQEKEQERLAKELALQQKEQERYEKVFAIQEKELAIQEKELAIQEKEQERLAKEQALSQAERLAAKLKELGIDPSYL